GGRVGTRRRAKSVQLASCAILALSLAPRAVPAPGGARRYVLAEIGGIGPGPVRASGADVVVDYEGNLALLHATASQIAQLRAYGVPITELTDRTVIRFGDAGVRFDTSGGEPALVPELRATNPHALMVRFIGPIKAAWLDEIRSLGGSPQRYVANAAYVTRMDAPTAQSVAALPYVNWVGPYQPAYKIPRALVGG